MDSGMSSMGQHVRWWGIVALGAVLAACGGEEETAEAQVANSPPVINGAPPTQVMEGETYSFAPTATDPDGDPLIFGIDGKPAWTTFETATGRPTGRPTRSDVGMHRGIAVWVSDGTAQRVLPTFDLTVVAAPSASNRAPQISGTAPASVVAGSTYTFTPTASDPDGNPLTFSILNKPSWATFTTTNGRLQGTPQVANAGTSADIAISVSDGQSAVALAAFNIVVTVPASNSAPVISGAPMPSVEAGSAYAFVPTAVDADGDALAFSVTGLPSWATFNTQTGRLAGTPAVGAIGTFGNIVIRVSDGTATTALPAFSITVIASTSNTPPAISGTPATTATQGTQYVFQPTAEDANNDALTYTIANRPT
jgi:hypothetical protein